VEIPIRRIANRPFAGARIQSEGGYEVSVGPLERRQLLIGQGSPASWESNALSVRALRGLFVKNFGHAFFLFKFIRVCAERFGARLRNSIRRAANGGRWRR
jgi:hypothetical protein